MGRCCRCGSPCQGPPGEESLVCTACVQRSQTASSSAFPTPVTEQGIPGFPGMTYREWLIGQVAHGYAAHNAIVDGEEAATRVIAFVESLLDVDQRIAAQRAGGPR